MLEQLVLGLHLASAHFPEREVQSNNTPGIYARIEDGWMAGIVLNSFGRWAAYGGKQLEPLPYVSLAVGVISGYQLKDRPCTYREKHEHGWVKCQTGMTNRAVVPMLVPSLYHEFVPGGTVRLNYMPRWSRQNGSEAINLAIEFNKDILK